MNDESQRSPSYLPVSSDSGKVMGDRKMKDYWITCILDFIVYMQNQPCKEGVLLCGYNLEVYQNQVPGFSVWMMRKEILK